QVVFAGTLYVDEFIFFHNNYQSSESKILAYRGTFFPAFYLYMTLRISLENKSGAKDILVKQRNHRKMV
ncbi:MAG: hypothetical protein KAH12_06610, partial [Anaerolineales bacterium]|nr:hypothetical protein [Anaerolineales bacterium]